MTDFVACHAAKNESHSNRSDFNSNIDVPNICLYLFSLASWVSLRPALVQRKHFVFTPQNNADPTKLDQVYQQANVNRELPIDSEVMFLLSRWTSQYCIGRARRGWRS